MSSYEEWRKASHLWRQACKRFGSESPEEKRAYAVLSFWSLEWHGDGMPIIAPPAGILSERINEAEKKMKKIIRDRAGEHHENR